MHLLLLSFPSSVERSNGTEGVRNDPCYVNDLCPNNAVDVPWDLGIFCGVKPTEYENPVSGTVVTHAGAPVAWELRMIDTADTTVATSLAVMETNSWPASRELEYWYHPGPGVFSITSVTSPRRDTVCLCPRRLNKVQNDDVLPPLFLCCFRTEKVRLLKLQDADYDRDADQPNPLGDISGE
ncbi:hypothetical protein TNCV_4724091 [Trichonephila clavipes]|uniref:Uncharacterized protein n=1 Tax=Trichonephila clavipes TaxID=2585209 RepID=A0A8X7BEY2_TRICX|nr:hypothetical protein TNCV_4724091 [Trichonephila clavipes]